MSAAYAITQSGNRAVTKYPFTKSVQARVTDDYRTALLAPLYDARYGSKSADPKTVSLMIAKLEHDLYGSKR